MTENRLAEIEARWTGKDRDSEDLREVFAEVRRLRAALREYGSHHTTCQCFQREVPRNCNCGFEAVLGQEEASGEVSARG